jgi:CubicO group peptidase (beta-lactamase class C family)
VIRTVFAVALCLAPVAAVLSQPEPAAAQAPEEPTAGYAADLLTRNYPAEGPGAVILVARGDTVLFRGARGEANIETGEPLRPDSVFRIASITKQFTAAGLLTLVEAGKVELDAPLATVLPDYPGGQGITIRQLLNHTAGVRDYTGLAGYGDLVEQDFTTAQLIGLFRDAPPDFEPGASWAYSNSGYVLIGAVIEAVTGLPWYEYLDQALFTPLGMNHTGYALDPALSARTVTGYSHDGRSVVPMRPISMTQPHAAGALVSNADDLLTWTRALHEGRVLRSDTYAQMIAPAAAAREAGIGYSLGLYNETVRHAAVLRHGGAISGFSSSLVYAPGPDITVVVLENDDASGEHDSSNTVMRRLTAMALGEPYPDAMAVPVEPAMLVAAEGAYRFDDGTMRTLRVADGGLMVQRGGSPSAVLTPIATDDFLYEDGFNRLKLERGANGTVEAIRFFANGDGDGEIGRRADALARPAAVSPPPAALDRLAGTYANGGLTLTVYVDGGGLKARMSDQPPVGLSASSPTEFDVEESDASLEFPAGDTPATQVIIRQNGRSLILHRNAG